MPSPSEPGSVPTIIGVPVLPDAVGESRNGNSVSVVENHSDHTAVTRLVPLLKKLAVGSKIPTAFQAAHIRDEGSSTAVTTRNEIPIIILPPSFQAQAQEQMLARTGVAGDGPALRAEPPKRSRFLRPVVVGLSLLALVTAAGVLVKKQMASTARADASRVAAPPRAAEPTPASAVAPVSEPAVIELPSTAQPTAAAAGCSVAGKPKMIAGQALLSPGVEVAAGTRGIVVGYAPRPVQAVSALVDPATLALTGSRVTHSHDSIRRVTPIPAPAPAGAAPSKNHRPKVAVSTDRPGDAIAMRRTSSGAIPIDLGTAGGQLVWAPHDSDEVNALWPLPGGAPIEGLRAVPLDASGRGYAMAFRRGTSIWTGFISAKGNHRLSPLGDLTETKGLGGEVGSPSIAVSGETVLVAWADRTDRKDAWGLRYRTWRLPHANEPAAETPASTFEVPEGGLGAPYIAPAVSSLGAGRFLLVWTEGPTSGHRVRGLTVDAEGHPQGSPLVISDEGENAGQAQAAILADGHGMVAYLAATPHGFKVMATSITCR
ncbi:hypothetical protein LZC95_33905 [Pendulispora brunnea]|uniref:Uncharacterized protein n=1 Tax=Pendulispora brunnea TaxID=2905690 RepID=A0ABZ2JY63_9BACT